MFQHYLDAHRAMLVMSRDTGGLYKVVKVEMNHFVVERV